ncbi:30S ribosomal protein S5 alanine N-acetyltransferase, partial [Citrobacter sp. AAK_AS5]
MSFLRPVTVAPMPELAGRRVTLRAPALADHAEWAALLARSRDFLMPWEPIWPADDLERAAFRRR